MNFLLMFVVLIFVFSVFIHYSHSAYPQRVQPSCAQIRAFVDGHNVRRQRVARGGVPRQPAAANMAYMVWDEDLADEAAKRAEHGVLGHNQVQITGSTRWSLIGENLFINYVPVASNEPNIEETLDIWFGEHKNFAFQAYSLSLPQNVGHYTQMVWAESTHIGCGISQKKENSWTTTMIVCYYGPAGNILGQAPYNTNGAAGSLRCVNRACQKPYGYNCRK